MFLFIVALILLAVGIWAVVVRFVGYNNSRVLWPRVVGAVLAVVGFVLLLTTVIVVVPPKTVGIPVTFGQVGPAMSNGIALKAPWTDVEEMPVTVQSLDAMGDKPTTVKDRDVADVFVFNNVRWSIKDDNRAASSLFLEFKDFDFLRDGVIQPAIREAAQDVFRTYDPLATDNPSNSELAERIRTIAQAKVGDRFTITSMTITFVDFANSTKDRINALNVERGNTRIAEQRALTATSEAEANRILSDSVSNDPNVLVAQCLRNVAEAPAGTYPAGFQCWPGGGGSVVVPAAR